MNEKKIITSSREFAEDIIDTVREPLIVLDKDLLVVSASRSFYEVFKVKPAETLGQYIPSASSTRLKHADTLFWNNNGKYRPVDGTTEEPR